MNKSEFNFFDFIAIIAFLVGVYGFFYTIENLKENRQQTEDTKEILIKLEKHLEEQDGLLGKED